MSVMKILHKNKTQYEEEFVKLFRTTYARLYNQACTMLNNEEDARDIVSAVYADLLVKKTPVCEINYAFLLIVVRNKCIDVIRHRNVEEANLQEVVMQENCVTASDNDMRIEEMQDFINSEMSPQTRRVLQMCYTKQLSYKEVAKELGISVNTVNKHISRAMRMLRRHFGVAVLVMCAILSMSIAAVLGHFSEKKESQAVAHSQVETESKYTSEGKADEIVFENTELQEIIQHISREYGVNIVCSNEKQAHVRLHFRYKTTDNVENVIERLNMFDKVSLSITER